MKLTEKQKEYIGRYYPKVDLERDFSRSDIDSLITLAGNKMKQLKLESRLAIIHERGLEPGVMVNHYRLSGSFEISKIDEKTWQVWLKGASGVFEPSSLMPVRAR